MRTRIAVATAIGCFAALPILGLGPAYVGRAAGAPKPPTGPAPFATFIKLPSLNSGVPSEPQGINDAGTVIVGRSWDRAGLLWAVKWTMQNGTWVVSKLPPPLPQPKGAVASGIDTFGNVVGHIASPPNRPVFWPVAGGSALLGCNSDVGQARAISANGQIIVGFVGNLQVDRQAAAWYPSGSCTEVLPPLAAGQFAEAWAVTGDGSIIGGRARHVSQPIVPVRWAVINGRWQIEQIDARPGTVRGANERGDLAGTVEIACPAVDGCRRAVIWSALATVTLETLGGEFSYANDINAQGEVVGSSTTSDGVFTPYFWSASTGMLPLPAGSKGAANSGGLPFALSDVRRDGTRLVVGTSDPAGAGVWIVRAP
jgi:uncharacterized membrane protein